MPVNSIPSTKPYHPTTFLERGVVVPFTTPLLGGARARLARRGLELIVHNPSGGRGVYVMPWTAITSIFRPTLYDKVLATRLAFLEKVTPAAIRNVARATAAEGLAGEAAMEAVMAAAQTDEAERRIAHRHLLLALTRQVNVVPGSLSAALGPDSPDLDMIALPTIAWLAQRLGQPATWGNNALIALADTLACVGVSADNEAGSIPRLLSRLRDTSAEISEWVGLQRNGDRVSYARMICSVADNTVSLAADMVSQARALTSDMVGLLRNWATDPGAVTRIAARPEWVLDGWEQTCLIWNFARDNAARRAALVEIVEYVPTLPREMNEWSGHKSELADLVFESGLITLNEDWRTGANLFDLIARNEHHGAAGSKNPTMAVFQGLPSI